MDGGKELSAGFTRLKMHGALDPWVMATMATALGRCMDWETLQNLLILFFGELFFLVSTGCEVSSTSIKDGFLNMINMFLIGRCGKSLMLSMCHRTKGLKPLGLSIFPWFPMVFLCFS